MKPRIIAERAAQIINRNRVILYAEGVQVKDHTFSTEVSAHACVNSWLKYGPAERAPEAA